MTFTGIYKVSDDEVQVRVRDVPKAVITAAGIVSTFDATAIAAVVIGAITIDEIPGTLTPDQMPALLGAVTTVAGDVTTSLTANVVDNTALAQMAAHTVKANPTAGLANAADATLDSTLEFNASALRCAALTGDVTRAAGSTTTVLAAGSAAALSSGTLLAARMPALTGDVTSSAGSVATTLAHGNAGNLDSGTLLAARMPALTGDVTSSAGSIATTLAAGSASNLNSGTLPAGRMPALTGDVTTSAGAVATTIASHAVTYAKIQSAVAASLMAATAGGGSFGEVTLNATLAFSGSTLQRAALTGDVTASAGSNATTLAAGSASNLNSGTLLAARMPALTGDVTTSAGAVATTIGANKVTVSMMAQATKWSLLANSTNATANIAALSATTDGDLCRLDGTALAFGKLKIASLSTGPGILTLATLDNAAALTVPCRSANSSGVRADLALATNAILQNQASVLVSTTAPINLDLSASTNDLGGLAAGCKGRNFIVCTQAVSSGSQTVVGFNVGDLYMDTPRMGVPFACKCVGVDVNIQHSNLSDPGAWTVTLGNATASTSATKSCSMANLASADNITDGALNTDLTFASGDRMRFYATGPACLSPQFRVTYYFVRT